MKILIIANNDAGLYQFRKELIEELVKEHKVTICLPDGEYISRLEAMGCGFIPCRQLERHGINPVKEIQLFSFYKKTVRQIQPDIVFTYTIKPNVYGGAACAGLGIPYAANVTGLGTAVENGGVLQKITLALYRFGLRKARRVFFQNTANRDFMLKHGVIHGACELLPGSGVNLEEFCYEEYPEETEKMTFLVIGRLMKDKGTDEVLQAAEIIKKEYPDISIKLLGSYDGNYEEKVNEAVSAGFVEYLGWQENVHGFIKDCHAAIHASYHEGMSNVLLETAATGRPVIAADIPGCREIFDDGMTGIAFQPKSVEALVGAVRKFILLPYEEKRKMGMAGRKKIEKEFDRKTVVRSYLREIELLRTQQL